MNEKEEIAYTRGRRSVYRRNLQTALIELGYDKSENLDVERLIKEREDALNALRSLCDNFGDNDWDENLYLSDIIDNHLGKHIHAHFPPINQEEGEQ